MSNKIIDNKIIENPENFYGVINIQIYIIPIKFLTK